MGLITDTMEQREGPEAHPAALDAAAILDSCMPQVMQVEPDSEQDRIVYWSTLVAGMLGCCSAAIGTQAAGVIGQRATDTVINHNSGDAANG